MRRHVAFAVAGLFLAAALAGCKTTADSTATTGLHGTAAASLPSQAVLASVSPDAALAPSDAGPGRPANVATEPQAYYIEFRARAGPVFHTYMLYGPLDEQGRPLEENFVGFHPKGGALGLVAGSAPIPVPGQLNKVWSDDHLPVLASYRATLGPAQYRNMVAFVERERQKTKYWNLWVYNCNSFAGEMARAAGLEAPLLITVIPPIYVAALAAMNEGGPVPDQATTTAASWTPPLRNDRTRYND